MYVTPGTTTKEIEKEIKRLETELHYNKGLTDIDRIALFETIDYLTSFLPVERW